MVNITKINGPVNVFRLEGEVSGINKVIYLFAEHHIPVCQQTKCPDLYTQDISDYFLYQFDKVVGSDRMVDFFFEFPRGGAYSQESLPEEEKRTQQYITSIDILVKKLARIPEYGENIRFHSMDIREYVVPWNNPWSIGNIFVSHRDLNMGVIDEIIQLTRQYCEYSDRMAMIYEHAPVDNYPIQLDKSRHKFRDNYNNNISEEDMIEHTKNILHKLKHRYNNKSIRDKIRELLEQLLNDMNDICKGVNESVADLNSYRDIIESESIKPLEYRDERNIYSISDKTIDVILSLVMKLYRSHDHTESLHVLLTDLYFLRRFLDKPYITNAAIYGGAAHTLNYLRLLTREFGFRITHAAYSKVDIEELNVIAKKTAVELAEFIYPDEIIQCSDMEGFPEAFQ